MEPAVQALAKPRPHALRTLAIDIGGTGIKAVVLSATGKPLTERSRVKTPRPATPGAVMNTIVELAKAQGSFDRVSVGFPGVVRRGVTLNAPNLNGRWGGFHLADALTKKLDELTKEKAAEAEKKKLAEQLAAELGTTNPPATAPAPSAAPAGQPATSWSPSEPLTIARAGSAYMNISFDVLMDIGGSTASDPSQFLQLGDHDPIKRGFSLRNAEIALDGAVDPYLKGFGNIVLKLDKDNQTEIELEEAYLLTTALPFNLQAKAGQFFANFGRQNPQHPRNKTGRGLHPAKKRPSED